MLICKIWARIWPDNAVQPFVVTLEPGAGSGERMIVHTGHEFVYCLSGRVLYTIDGIDYPLEPGDSVVFEAHLPHQWINNDEGQSQIILILYPADQREELGRRHFTYEYKLNEELLMKIAVITDDGKTISQHFGRAPYYMVLSIEDGKIVHRELRAKMGHNQFSAIGPEEHHQEQHGMDEASHDKHIQMAGSIADCQALLCGGMGMGAYESMRRLNIQPIVTDLQDIEAAVQAYIDGKLVDHTEKLH